MMKKNAGHGAVDDVIMPRDAAAHRPHAHRAARQDGGEAGAQAR